MLLDVLKKFTLKILNFKKHILDLYEKTIPEYNLIEFKLDQIVFLSIQKVKLGQYKRRILLVFLDEGEREGGGLQKGQETKDLDPAVHSQRTNLMNGEGRGRRVTKLSISVLRI